MCCNPVRHTHDRPFLYICFTCKDNICSNCQYFDCRAAPCRFRADCIEGESQHRLAMVHHISPPIVNNAFLVPLSVHAVPLCDGGRQCLDMIDWFAGRLATHNNSSDCTVFVMAVVLSG